MKKVLLCSGFTTLVILVLLVSLSSTLYAVATLAPSLFQM